jgi:hypothetical protein
MARPGIEGLINDITRAKGVPRSKDVARVARAIGAMVFALGFVVGFGMRFGPPELRAAHAFVTERLADFTSVNAVAWTAAAFGACALVAGVGHVAKPTPAQLRLVFVGTVFPFLDWLGISPLVPADIAMWGVVITAIVVIAMTYGLLTYDAPEPADPGDQD